MDGGARETAPAEAQETPLSLLSVTRLIPQNQGKSPFLCLYISTQLHTPVFSRNALRSQRHYIAVWCEYQWLLHVGPEPENPLLGSAAETKAVSLQQSLSGSISKPSISQGSQMSVVSIPDAVAINIAGQCDRGKVREDNLDTVRHTSADRKSVV